MLLQDLQDTLANGLAQIAGAISSYTELDTFQRDLIGAIEYQQELSMAMCLNQDGE